MFPPSYTVSPSEWQRLSVITDSLECVPYVPRQTGRHARGAFYSKLAAFKRKALAEGELARAQKEFEVALSEHMIILSKQNGAIYSRAPYISDAAGGGGRILFAHTDALTDVANAFVGLGNLQTSRTK